MIFYRKSRSMCSENANIQFGEVTLVLPMTPAVGDDIHATLMY